MHSAQFGHIPKKKRFLPTCCRSPNSSFCYLKFVKQLQTNPPSAESPCSSTACLNGVQMLSGQSDTAASKHLAKPRCMETGRAATNSWLIDVVIFLSLNAKEMLFSASQIRFPAFLCLISFEIEYLNCFTVGQTKPDLKLEWMFFHHFLTFYGLND